MQSHSSRLPGPVPGPLQSFASPVSLEFSPPSQSRFYGLHCLQKENGASGNMLKVTQPELKPGLSPQKAPSTLR